MNPSAENSRRWIAALSNLPDGAARELAAENDVFADDKRYAIRINDEFTVDVMPSIAGLDWEEMKQHITITEIDGVRIRLLDLPGLLKTKQGLRPKDQMDASIQKLAQPRLHAKCCYEKSEIATKPRQFESARGLSAAMQRKMSSSHFSASEMEAGDPTINRFAGQVPAGSRGLEKRAWSSDLLAALFRREGTIHIFPPRSNGG